MARRRGLHVAEPARSGPRSHPAQPGPLPSCPAPPAAARRSSSSTRSRSQPDRPRAGGEPRQPLRGLHPARPDAAPRGRRWRGRTRPLPGTRCLRGGRGRPAPRQGRRPSGLRSVAARRSPSGTAAKTGDVACLFRSPPAGVELDRGLREAVRVAQCGAFPHVRDHEAGPGGVAAGGYTDCSLCLRDRVADEAFGQGHQRQRLQTADSGRSRCWRARRPRGLVRRGHGHQSIWPASTRSIDRAASSDNRSCSDAAVAARSSSPMASGYRAPAERTLARPVRTRISTPTSGPSASTCRGQRLGLAKPSHRQHRRHHLGHQVLTARVARRR